MDDITAIQDLPCTVALLVNDGPVLPELTRPRAQHQIAGAIQAQAIDTVKLHANGCGIGARGHYQVVLQLPLVTVENQVHAGVQLLIADTGIVRSATDPFGGIVTHKVAADGGLPSVTGHLGRALRAGKAHPQRGVPVPLRPGQVQLHGARAQ
jgi:hypothetical protein